MRRFAVPAAICLLFLAGIAAVLYPLVSNRLYEKDQSQVLAEYDASVEAQNPQTLEAAMQAAQDYNRSLLTSQAVLTDPFDPEQTLDPTVEPYASLLNLEGDGMMGYLEIPAISVYLPIYHGTTAAVLEKGVGHLQNTSLPVGGETTHAALTGHTGLSGKRLFTDLSQLQQDDAFYLHILDQTLAYQVRQIEIVKPDQTQLLAVEPGQDLVTLITCHPYGVNTHRLLVQGVRISNPQALEQERLREAQSPQRKSVWAQEYQKALLICLMIYLPVLIVILLILRRKKRAATKKECGDSCKEPVG